MKRKNRKIVRMAGVLGASLEEIPAGDPIAEALDELREERVKQFDLRNAGETSFSKIPM